MDRKYNSINLVVVETFSEGQKGSMPQYSNLLISALTCVSKNNHVNVTRVNLSLSKKMLQRFSGRLRSRIYQLWIILSGKLQLRRCKGDIIHILDGSHAYLAKWLPSGIPSVVTTHDIIPLLQSNCRFPVRPPGRIARWLIKGSVDGLKIAGKIISDSQHTKYDLTTTAEIDSKKITVVYPALSSEILEGNKIMDTTPWHERRQSAQAYILHVGNNAFYKNRLGVLSIFDKVKKKCKIKLKMAGPAPTSELIQKTEEFGLKDDVEFICNPDDSNMFELYKHASLFLFPSIYEGFGWPPLEAMACGCPVVCSNAASLPEVVGDAALTCSPDDETKMAENCITVLNDEKLASELISKGFAQVSEFTLEKMAEGLLEVYLSVLKVKS